MWYYRINPDTLILKPSIDPPVLGWSNRLELFAILGLFTIWARAESFATSKHAGQVVIVGGGARVETLIQVARVAYEYIDGDENVLAAAVLQDVLNDTNTSVSELREEFGDEIATLIEEMTNDTLEMELLGTTRYLAGKISKLSGDALLIKLIDRCINLQNIPDRTLLPEELDWLSKYVMQTGAILQLLEQRFDLTCSHKELIKKINDAIFECYIILE